MASKKWKKEWLVIRFDDYDNTWESRTIPCTELQAYRFVLQSGWMVDNVSTRVVKLDEFASFPQRPQSNGAVA